MPAGDSPPPAVLQIIRVAGQQARSWAVGSSPGHDNEDENENENEELIDSDSLMHLPC